MNKRLKCPICSARLIDEAEHIKSEVRAIKQNQDWQADYFTKCWHCKNEIGIKRLRT